VILIFLYKQLATWENLQTSPVSFISHLLFLFPSRNTLPLPYAG